MKNNSTSCVVFVINDHLAARRKLKNHTLANFPGASANFYLAYMKLRRFLKICVVSFHFEGQKLLRSFS